LAFGVSVIAVNPRDAVCRGCEGAAEDNLAVSSRWRWAVACAIAGAVPLAVPRGADAWVGPVVFGLAVGIVEAVVVGGPQRVRWLALTALGVWLAFPFGFIAGFATFYAIALPLSLSGLTGDPLAVIGLIGAILAGGAAGGALVGALQAGRLSGSRTWILRSAGAGVFMVPAAAVALYGPTTNLGAQPTTLAGLAAASIVGGGICGLITGGGVTHAVAETSV
jgi:hypothetical protein